MYDMASAAAHRTAICAQPSSVATTATIEPMARAHTRPRVHDSASPSSPNDTAGHAGRSPRGHSAAIAQMSAQTDKSTPATRSTACDAAAVHRGEDAAAVAVTEQDPDTGPRYRTSRGLCTFVANRQHSRRLVP